jgi:hypothetical protein
MNIREAINEKQQQIKKLEQEIGALQIALGILEKTQMPIGFNMQPKSQPEMAALVLEEVGKPVHIRQIAAQIKKTFGVTIKPNNLGVMLFRYSKRGSRFYKAKGKPSTYGLIKWQDLSERIEAARTHDANAVVSSA